MMIISGMNEVKMTKSYYSRKAVMQAAIRGPRASENQVERASNPLSRKYDPIRVSNASATHFDFNFDPYSASSTKPALIMR